MLPRLGGLLALLGLTGVAALAACGDSSPSTPRTPVNLAAQTSVNIDAVVGATVAPAPAVLVLDAGGRPVPDVAVTFSVGSGAGTLQTAAQRTGTDGIASVGGWTLGTAAGVQTLIATVQGLTPVQFAATARPDVPASVTALQGALQSAVAGSAVATPPEAEVRDRYGNAVPDVTVTFAVAQGNGSISTPQVKTDAAGVARLGSWTLGADIGINAVTAAVGGVATPATFTATATTGPPARLTIVAGATQAAVVNTPVATVPAVRLTDDMGNPVAGAPVAFAVSSGGGSVAQASVVTGTDGLAASGAWTLGKTAGANVLTASLGAFTAAFTATGTPGPASALVMLAGPPAQLVVGSVASPAPALRVTDAYGNAVAGSTVQFSIVQGAGTLLDATRVSDASGSATLGNWTLGIRPGPQSVQATVGGVAPLAFNVTTVAGPPAVMSLVAGADQFTVAGTLLPIPPAVQVVDRYDNPTPGLTVSFAAVGVSGTVTGAAPVTNAQGSAALGSWTVGPDEGMDSVYATVGDLPPLPIYARVVPVSHYDVLLRFLTPATPRQEQAFLRAIERWRAVLIGDLPDVPAVVPANACGMGEPALNEVIDDVLIYVRLDSIDGPGGLIGSAFPCATRNPGGLTVIGVMRFDTADLAQLDASGQLDNVILHEMGHVFGIGSLWQSFALLTGAGTADPYFTGASGRSGFSLVGGDAYAGNPVPVENLGPVGTRDSHWRESVLTTELMTGYASPAGVPMPLSLLTIGSLEDLGYAISAWGYDTFHLGASLQESVAAPGLELREASPPPPLMAIDAAGRIVMGAAAVAAAPLRAPGGGGRVARARAAPTQPLSVRRR